MITVYRKKDGKPISCNKDQLDLLTAGKDAVYSLEKPKAKKEKVAKSTDPAQDASDV